MKKITIATRGSGLALWQSNWVKSQIELHNEGVEVELMIMKTQGDIILDVPLAKVGGKGLFVKELETAMLEGRADIAVHSMKDVPTELPDGLFLASICEREDPRDAFVSTTVDSFAALPQGARIGTSSLRRQAQLLNRRPDLEILPLRGNVGTRLRKLTDEKLDAIILATAGLKRLDRADAITEYMSVEDSLPAVAQGAVGIEARVDDIETLSIIDFLDHDETRVAVEAERAFLARLEGGCQVPIAAHATLNEGKLTLTGLVGAIDGTKIFKEIRSASQCDRTSLGVGLAETLLNQGAGEILKEAYGS